VPDVLFAPARPITVLLELNQVASPEPLKPTWTVTGVPGVTAKLIILS
jgi:hypothetical protein